MLIVRQLKEEVGSVKRRKIGRWMAGIGFELKKIYRKKNIVNILHGIGYSTMVTVGPTIITILVIMAMYRLLRLSHVSYADRELLSSTALYAFIFPLIISTPFNSVLSRYIADKIFEQKLDDILPSYYVGIVLTVSIQAMLAIPFYLHLYIVSDCGAVFVFVSYCLSMVVLIIFFSMIYLTATKNYKIITFNFLFGMLLALFLGLVFVNVLQYNTINGVIYALTIGFFFIAAGEFSYIRRCFNVNSRCYRESLSYLFQMKRLFFSGLFYALGLYVHNFVFWTTDLSVVVKDSYISAPTYDVATYLAMLTNISLMVIFIVKVETSFHNRYKIFSEAVIGATLRDIEKAKNDMFRLLVQQISYVAQVQAIITCAIFLIVIIFFEGFGFSGITMALYPTLALGYFVIYIMYCNIIFLYYFADMNGAFFTSLLFFLGVLAGSIVASHLSIRWYGLGTLIGAWIGWTFSFFRIRYIERNMVKFIFLNGTIIKLSRRNIPSPTVYIKK
jgi:uncharacterized membrane protein